MRLKQNLNGDGNLKKLGISEDNISCQLYD